MARRLRLTPLPRPALKRAGRRHNGFSALVVPRKALERASDPAPMQDLLGSLDRPDVRSFALKSDLRFTTDLRAGSDAGRAGKIFPVASLGVALAYFAGEAERSAMIEREDENWVVIADTT